MKAPKFIWFMWKKHTTIWTHISLYQKDQVKLNQTPTLWIATAVQGTRRRTRVVGGARVFRVALKIFSSKVPLCSRCASCWNYTVAFLLNIKKWNWTFRRFLLLILNVLKMVYNQHNLEVVWRGWSWLLMHFFSHSMQLSPRERFRCCFQSLFCTL